MELITSVWQKNTLPKHPCCLAQACWRYRLSIPPFLLLGTSTCPCAPGRLAALLFAHREAFCRILSTFMPSVLFITPFSAEVTVPVSMKEVGGYIEKQVAYLSGEALGNYFSINHPFTSIFWQPRFSFSCPGGRGEDSSVIVTLPECSAFSDIPEEALAKVFTYLTLIPRCVLLLLLLEKLHFLLQCTKKPVTCSLSRGWNASSSRCWMSSISWLPRGQS